ncbi:receptor-like protein 35 [Gossypium arboreum]|uniref:receptor-like protein 35 n=1 Tax=Gossypium arboreum TaxID=29729 RepID=UPI0022F18FCE|nr:receptor-like protein 35 [Gossypium arboreum]
MLYLILCFLLGFFNSSLLSLSLSLPPTHLCRPEHSSALLKFKRSLSLSYSICLQELQIPSFHETESSDEGTDCCKWKGVVCDNKKGNVVGLDLSSSGLIGSLQSDSSLFSLQNLRWLNLAGNDFGNTEIPSEFETRFSKGLPGSIGNLKHLKTLSLFHCVFTGFIPSALGNLTKLTFLDISGNMFQGQIPDVFGNLNDLSSMDFSFINFSGVFPLSAFNLTNLTYMKFFGNFLHDTLPNNISGLSYLRELYLNANLLTDRVPGLFFRLPSLEHLDLSSNKLYGPIDTIQEPNLLRFVYLS